MKLKNLFDKSKTVMIRDFKLNIIASIVLTIATQILAYPYLSRVMKGNEYGLVLTIMGIVNAIGGALGNALDNTRILLHNQYEIQGVNGDYNIIFLFCAAADIIIVTILSVFILHKDYLSIIGCVIISILVLFRSYYSVSYRITINYRKYLYSNLFGLLGYIFGIGITYLTNLWILTFIFGELCSCIYIFFTATIIHDKFQITELFKTSLKKYSFILEAAIISTMMTYMDRFFIYPMLGAEKVSIYNVASFLGKTAGILINPIAGVLLTYYTKEHKLTLSQFYRRMSIFVGTSILFYILIVCVGLPATGILYPTIINDAVPFFAIANLGTTIFVLGNAIQPTLLRFCNTKWQPVIQGIYLTLYIVFGIVWMKSYGLIGFCYSVLLANIVKVMLMMLITILTLKKNRNEGGSENE